MIRRVAIVALLAMASAAYGQGWDLLGALWTEPSGAAVDLTANLQHYWYGANGTNDAGTGGKNLVNVNGTTITTNGFDFGTGTAYLRTSGPISNGTAYTITAWLRPNVSAMAGHTYGGWFIADRENSPTSKTDFEALYDRASGTAGFNYHSTVAYIGCSAGVLTNDVWEHLAWTVDYSAGTQKVFRSGAFFRGAVATNAPNNGSTINFTLGVAAWNVTDAQGKYHGILDNIRFYSNAKDDAFIQAVYNADKAAKGL